MSLLVPSDFFGKKGLGETSPDPLATKGSAYNKCDMAVVMAKAFVEHDINQGESAR